MSAATTAIMKALDAEYGSWYRLELRDGQVVYVGGCGECETPWFATDDAPPRIKGEWRDVTT